MRTCLQHYVTALRQVLDLKRWLSPDTGKESGAVGAGPGRLTPISNARCLCCCLCKSFQPMLKASLTVLVPCSVHLTPAAPIAFFAFHSHLCDCWSFPPGRPSGVRALYVCSQNAFRDKTETSRQPETSGARSSLWTGSISSSLHTGVAVSKPTDSLNLIHSEDRHHHVLPASHRSRQ